MAINYFVALILSMVALMLPNLLGRRVSEFVFLTYCLFRGDYGNDYYVYKDYFYQISDVEWTGLVSFAQEKRLEVLWVIICRLFDFLTFETFYLIISIIITVMFIVILRRISNNNPITNLLLLLYVVLDPDILLVSFSAIRQWLAILLVWHFIYLGSAGVKMKFLLILIIAQVHYSALVALVFPFISWLENKVNFVRLSLVISLFYILISLSRDLIVDAFPRYSGYINIFQGKEVSTGLNILWYLGIGLIGVKINRKILPILMIFLAFTFLGGTLGILTRLSWYFIIVVPLIIADYMSMTTKFDINVRKMMLLLAFSVLVIKSYKWFNSITWYEGYFTYL